MVRGIWKTSVVTGKKKSLYPDFDGVVTGLAS